LDVEKIKEGLKRLKKYLAKEYKENSKPENDRFSKKDLSRFRVVQQLPISTG
jgi:hypothetical protein